MAGCVPAPEGTVDGSFGSWFRRRTHARIRVVDRHDASGRKGLAQGLTRADMEQVVALAAGTVGLPATAAAFTWIRDILDGN